MNQQEIGHFIAEKRRAKNLTQEQLAELLGVSNKTISKWETGKSIPDYSVVELLCKELNITIPELLAGKDNKSESIPEYTKEQVDLLLYKVEQMEKEKKKEKKKRNIMHFDMSSGKTIKTGITTGSVLAMIISYAHWQSIGWAILHGLMSWGYVIYYLIKY